MNRVGEGFVKFVFMDYGVGKIWICFCVGVVKSFRWGCGEVYGSFNILGRCIVLFRVFLLGVIVFRFKDLGFIKEREVLLIFFLI